MKGSISVWIILAFAATYIIWGTTYLAIRIGLETIPPFIIGCMRYSLAGLVLLVIALSKGEHIFHTPVVRHLLVGAVLLGAGQGILFWAELYIATGYAAVLVSTLPIWFVILDKKNWLLYWQQKKVLWGLLFGFAGILLLFKKFFGQSIPGSTIKLELIASGATLISCISWASASLYHKKNPVHGSIYLQLGWQLTGGLIICSIIALLTGEWYQFSMATVSLSSLWAVIYLALAGSVICFLAYTWLLTKKPAAVVGTYAYVNPVIAVILGALVLNEIITWEQIVGMVIILFSAFLVTSSPTPAVPQTKAKAT